MNLSLFRLTICLFFGLFIFCPTKVYSQLQAVPSPTAANLGLYGDIPVSYFTGTPNISIPLYEIKGKQINVPISLSYHSAGIRPDTHPGPTGVGWSLMAGGVITRTVRGSVFDEAERFGGGGGYLSYVRSSNNLISGGNWRDNTAYKQAQGENVDLEPDEFSFNFLGISGKFYFSQNGEIKVQSKELLTVTFDEKYIDQTNLGFRDRGDRSRMFRGFVITDAQGNKYHFGDGSAIEVSSSIIKRFLIATSWFLTKIVSFDNSDEITFTYERGPFTSHLYYQSNMTYYKIGKAFARSIREDNKLHGNFVSPVYLTNIKRTNGESIEFDFDKSGELRYQTFNPNIYNSLWTGSSVSADYWYEILYDCKRSSSGNTVYLSPWYEKEYFVENPQNPSELLDRLMWLKLNGITIKNMYGRHIKHVRFDYNNKTSHSERLYLENLHISTDEEYLTPSPPAILHKLPPLPVQTYRFKYKNRDKCEPYLAIVTDYWGFANGIKGRSTSTAQRTPSPFHVDNGVLDTLYYPTGGFNKFEYELNSYSKIVNTKDRTTIQNIAHSAKGGGIRIKSIESHDGEGNKYTREFFYSTSPSSGTSSGVLNMLPTYEYMIKGATSCYDSDAFESKTSMSNPIIPLTQANDGLSVGYTQIGRAHV